MCDIYVGCWACEDLNSVKGGDGVKDRESGEAGMSTEVHIHIDRGQTNEHGTGDKNCRASQRLPLW